MEAQGDQSQQHYDDSPWDLQKTKYTILCTHYGRTKPQNVPYLMPTLLQNQIRSTNQLQGLLKRQAWYCQPYTPWKGPK